MPLVIALLLGFALGIPFGITLMAAFYGERDARAELLQRRPARIRHPSPFGFRWQH